MQETINKPYKHIFADLDGTLTESRSRASSEMVKLIDEMNIIVVSGAGWDRILDQVDGAGLDYLAQSGNHCSLWRETLGKFDVQDIIKHIGTILKYAKPFSRVDDLIEDRGSQITFSFVGHHAPLEAKKRFDPTGQVRVSILKDHPFEENSFVSARVAGTTSIDYSLGDKGSNIKRYIKQMGWEPGDCVYIGDALFPGGNDHSVVGVIDTIPTTGPQKTLDILQNLQSIVIQ